MTVPSRQSVPWASATFVGARHVFEIDVDDPSRVVTFVAEIDEAEIALRRGFVADVAVQARDGNRLTIEVLTILDA